MAEESKVRDVVDAVTGLVKSIPVYQDALQPAAQELGKALHVVAKTVHIALAPVSMLVWGYGQIRDFVSTKVADRLKNVPPENVITPNPNVAGPALEALRYTGHESALSDLYANLLATAMDKATAEGAHPAFVDIIRQLTSDEAKLIAFFVQEKPFPLINLRWQFKTKVEGKIGGVDVLVNYSHLGQLAGCLYPQMTPSYIDNLCRLGLAAVPSFFEYTTSGAYDPLETDPYVKGVMASIEANPELKPVIQRKGLQITQLGRQFIHACVVSKA